MSDNRAAMRAAVEALQGAWCRDSQTMSRIDAALSLLRAALEAPQQQQVAWAVFARNGNIRMWSTNTDAIQQFAIDEGVAVTPLCASPVAAAPQPTLSNEQILHLWDTRVGSVSETWPLSDKDKLNFARAVLAASPQTPPDGAKQ